jgi:hypothetical protein
MRTVVQFGLLENEIEFHWIFWYVVPDMDVETVVTVL